MKLSPWWDAVTQPPVHVGWYEIRFKQSNERGIRHWWDGHVWRVSPSGSALKFFGACGDQWRGVLREDE